MKKQIPNIITSLNLLSGVFGTIAALEGQYIWVLGFIVLSAIFDFFDGLVARLLGVSSPIGKELDSLADNISFGLVPALIAFKLMADKLNIEITIQLLNGEIPTMIWLTLIGLIISPFSAYRLAKFNLDTRQTTSFIGLATPANALFWAGLANSNIINQLPIWSIAILAIISCYLLICELPMFSFKIHSLKPKDALFQYLLVGGAIALLIIFHLEGIAYTIIWYLLLSITKWIMDKNKSSK